MFSKLNEQLLANDLRRLVQDIFEIDSYASKMGSDEDIVVLAFTVMDVDAAQDLENFIERGYDFVLDADATPGELSNGKYKVFVEIERTHRIAEQILELLDGIRKLADLHHFRFRYYKGFHSQPCTLDALSNAIPDNKDDYNKRIKQSQLNNFSNFFNKSFVESVSIDNDDLVFQKVYAGPLRLKIRDFGRTNQVYDRVGGRIMIESTDVSEMLYLTKYLGNYNITKVNNLFVLENNGFALAVNVL